jgi:signal transduction histidine kinase
VLSLESIKLTRVPPLVGHENDSECRIATEDSEWLSQLTATRDVPACVIEIERRDGRIDYRFVAASPAFAGATGLDDVVGRTMRELRPDHEQYWFDLYARIEETGEPAHFEHAAHALDCMYRGFAFRIGRAGDHRVVIVFEKVSEESCMARFGATLAHELRGPLAPLGHGLHVLKRLTPDEPRAQQTLAMMDRQLRQLSALVEDLMDIGAFRAANVHARHETVDLHHVVSDCVETCSTSLDARRHELAFHSDGKGLAVRGDAQRLRQVFSNLLTNSIKYTPPGGHIVIRFARDADAAVVEVCDDGIGMSEQELPHVFELFKQAEAHRDVPHGGLGIGLAVVKDIVELHGGTVTAHSDGPGRGSTFRVRLPCL